MKNSFLALMFFITSSIIFAQNPIGIGQTQVNAGFGLSSWGLPVYVGFDNGIHNDITLGGEFSFRTYNSVWKSVQYNHTIFAISGNGNYHFNRILNIPRNWNFYAGLNIGFHSVSSPKYYPGNVISGLGLGMQVGGRYYFNEKFGINLEFGGGNAFSGGKFGVSIKL